ncbi:MAG: beta-propeller fold lactonase family protein [Candidatus Velthaea sp.]
MNAEQGGVRGADQGGDVTVVFVACAASSEVAVFTLEREKEALELTQCIPVPAGITPLALDPQQRFLFAGLRGERPAVLSFAIDPHSGRLELLGDAPLPDPPMYFATDASGRFLLSASYAAASFAINAIGADGRVEGQPAQHTATPPHAHGIITDPTGRYLFVTALGGDAILQYTFDASSGRAVANAVPSVAATPGSGPRHLVFHPNRAILYVNGELDGRISSYALDPLTGVLRALACRSMLSETNDAKPWAAELAVDPAGCFLYASERRTNTLSIFDVRDELGALERREIVETEEQPRSFAIDPRGEFLVVAGEKSNHLTVYEIDARRGHLRARGRCVVGEKPTWVKIAVLTAVPK